MNKPDFSGRTLIYRQIVVMAAVALIFIGCLIILLPFIPALLLAGILCLSTWPAFTRLERRLGGNVNLAALLMTLALALCFLAPLILFGASLGESFRGLITEVVASLQNGALAQTPGWIRDIPWAGEHLDAFWQQNIADKDQLTQTLKDNSGLVTNWLIAIGASIGRGVIDISLGVIIAFFFFQKGQMVVDRLRNLVENFGGERSIRLLHVTANTVIGVVYGILGTALVLAALSTLGFWIAKVPGAPFLGLVTFLLGIIPGGPGFILVPVTAWLFIEGHTGMGIFMALWSLALVAALDMAVRPYLISKGSKMPLILVLLGIFGGVAAFGFIGLFIGPALLAIASALITEWSRKRDSVAAV